MLMIITDIMCPYGEMSGGRQNNRDGMKNLPSVIDLIAYASFLFPLLLPTVVR